MDVSTPTYMDAGSSSPISSPPLSVQGKDEISFTNGDQHAAQGQYLQAPKPQPHLNQQAADAGSDTSSTTLKATSAVQSWSLKDSNPASAGPSTVAKKPGPKKKKEEGSGSTTGDGTKPARKPRKPRDPDAPPRKRAKKTEEGAAAPTSQQSRSFGLNSNIQPAPAPNAMTGFASLGSNGPGLPPGSSNPAALRPIQPQTQTHSPPSSQPTSQPRGQRFDPIRSASAENARLAHSNSPGPQKMPPTPPPHARPGASIASLIDPRPQSSAPTQEKSAPNSVEKISSGPPSPVKAPVKEPAAPSVGLAKIANGVVANQETITKDVNGKLQINGKSGASSRAASPKPPRKKKELPQVPPGNGLLSVAAFGKSDNAERVFAEVPNQCIVIEVPITAQTGNYVNFIREVENKYGFDVAHPRLAEHRKRMAEMAAAGAAIESGAASADEMALDGSDVDSNVEMDGVDEETGGAEGTGKKKKTKRGDEYDKTDDFIDDTEQAWEERAMVSRDGYFVWSGPLMQEEDKPSTEKNEGPVKRSRGGRGGRGGASRGESSGRGSRGGGTKRGASGGTGSRGGRGGSSAGAMRKPRMTKAEQKEREAEKANREKIAANLSKEPVVPAGIIGI